MGRHGTALAVVPWCAEIGLPVLYVMRPTCGANNNMDTTRTSVFRTPSVATREALYEFGPEPGLLFFKLAVITMLVQSIVVSTAIKGLLIPYLLILSQFGKDMIVDVVRKPKVQVFVPFICIGACFVTYEAAVQLANLVTHPQFSNMILVSSEGPESSFMRSSLITQGIYLATCVLFFLYIVRYLQSVGSPDQVIKLANIGMLLFLAFGLYEFVGYFLTGHNVDFLSNRVTGEYLTYSTFQTIPLGGVALPRMKSLAGEASMFAFSTVPFAVLFYYMKKSTWMLCLAAALLSTSTTAYIGIFCFLVIDMVISRRISKILLSAAIAVMYLWLTKTGWFMDLIDFALSKFRLEHMSGMNRMDNFSNSLAYFANSDMFHKLFGYGFGYIRSTDGITTLLINTGLIGLVVFVVFLLYPFVGMKCNTGYRRGLLAATIVEVVMVLTSVTEFFYLHMWFIAALSWFEYWRERQAAAKVAPERHALLAPTFHKD
jgi:hypothetical protein